MERFGKEIRFVTTQGVRSFCSDIELGGYIIALYEIWNNTPIIGIHVFENVTEGEQLKLTIMAEGTDIKRNEEIYREVYRTDSLNIPKFWCITEDHGEFILATFLLPDEY